MQNSNGMGNMLRLQGLKNVSGRRVMPGQLPFEDEEEFDVSGTAQEPILPKFENFIPPAPNQPAPDMGGEVTPQSYDVRANSVIPPETPNEEPNILQKLGQSLGQFFTKKNIPQENLQQPEQANQINQIPPASRPITPPPLLNAISEEYNKPYNFMGLKNGANYVGEKLKEDFTSGLHPSVIEKYPHLQAPEEIQSQQEQQTLDQDELRQAQEHPYEISVYGATDAFANDPKLISEFETYTGLNFDEEQKEMTKKYEQVMSDMDKGLDTDMSKYDEQEQRILERIKTNTANDSDKFYIGLALLMPLIVGGIFGKEAALGTLGGGAQGLANVYKGREENIRKDEEILGDIGRQKGIISNKKNEIELEKLKIPSEIRKNLPKDENADLKGMDIYTFKDPKTGEVIGTGAQILPDFFADLKYANTPKTREKMRAKATELAQEKSALQRANEATANVVKAVSQLKDSKLTGKMISYALSEDKNGAMKKLYKQNAPDVIIDGRKVNSAVYLDSQIELIKDAYRRNEQMKSFTNAVADHVGALVENPQYSGLNPDDLVEQILLLRDRGQNFFVDRVESQGFLPFKIREKLGEENKKLYKGLNRKEELKEIENDKKNYYLVSKNG